MKTLEISGIEEKELFIMAFRYALGRSTYVVHDMVSLILRNWGNLRNDERVMIKKEITCSIEARRAGMDIDVKEWQKVLNYD